MKDKVEKLENRKDFYRHDQPEWHERTKLRLIEIAELGLTEVGNAEFGVKGVMSGLYIEMVWSHSYEEWKGYIQFTKDLLLKAYEEDRWSPEPVKLTKKVLNGFITWTTSRYNDYLGFGTKEDAVLTAYHSILKGYQVHAYANKRGLDKGKITLREKPEEKFVKLECATGVGERPTNSTGSSRYWPTKKSGDEYTVDCVKKTIVAKYSKRIIKFI